MYPMKVPSREAEKNPTIIDQIGKASYKNFIDLLRIEPFQALEGTGSLLFDNRNKKVYCSL